MSDETQKILVVLPNPLGDAVLATPALTQLRRRLPESHITLLGNNSVVQVLKYLPYADTLLDYGDFAPKGWGLLRVARWLKGFGFDAVILMTNSFRSALFVKLAGIRCRAGYDRDGRGRLLSQRISPFRLLKRYAPVSMLHSYTWLVDQAVEGLQASQPPSVDEPCLRMSLQTGPEDEKEVDERIQRWGLSPEDSRVLLVPGGAFGGSKWWPAEKYAALADALSGAGHKVILLCAPNDAEKKIARQIKEIATTKLYTTLDPPASLGAIKALVRRCSLMIANDTGPCHIAAAFDVPLVTLFGPTDPRWTATGYDKEIRLRVDVDCGPCQQPVCRTDHRCLERIDVNRVLSTATDLLPSKPRQDQSAAHTDTFYHPYNESFVPLPDGSGLIHQDYRELLAGNNLDSLEGVFAYQQGEKLVKPGLGRRERLRIELVSQTGRKSVIYLKRHAHPGVGERLMRWVKNGSRALAALYDFDASLALSQIGIPVARPLAWGGERHWLGGQRSFVMLEELPQADSLERLLPEWEKNKSRYHTLRNKKGLIEQIARQVRHMHDSGLFHRDLYLAHLFLSKDRLGQERICLIDLQRVFRPRFCRRRWQVKDLAQLMYSSLPFVNKSDKLRFLQSYFGSSKLNTAEKQLSKAIAEKCQRIARHDTKKQKRESPLIS